MPSTNLSRALDRLDVALRPFLSTVRARVDGDVWAVGGFVRDILMGRRPYDLDLAVAAAPRAAARRLAAALDGHAFPLDEERGTFRVALPEHAPLTTIDVAALRGPDIESDLAARDFTVNAMASLLEADGLGPLLDPLNGRADVRTRTVRMISEEALREDPLRLLRAGRLAVELGFEVEDRTASVIRTLAESVLQTAAERQRDELLRILASSQASKGLRLLDALRLLEVILPEVTRGRGVTQPGRYHHFDVFDHSIEAVAVTDWLLSMPEPAGRTPRALRRVFWDQLGPYGLREYFAQSTGGQSRLVLTKLATLLHDVSKPETKGLDESGRMRFLGHAEQGAKVSRSIARRLRLGNRETAFVSLLVEEHLRPPQLSQSGLPTERAIFRFFRALGEAAPACLVLSLADAAAAMGPRLTLSLWNAQLAYISYVFGRAKAQAEALGRTQGRPFEPGQGKRHFVSGDKLIKALGIAPGPEVGRLIAALDEAAGAGELRTQEEAIDLARQLHEKGAAESRDHKAGVA